MEATLVHHARSIWQAGVAAVDGTTLVNKAVHCTTSGIRMGTFDSDWSNITQIIIVGAGKAGAAMAAGLLAAIPTEIAQDKSLRGWVNVPNELVRPMPFIHLHAARPLGHNQPTRAGVAGSREIKRLVSKADPDALVVCLLSGGGSALLPLPSPGITWQDKAQVTELLSSHGANIRDLNTVRKQLSEIKGGGLAKMCRAKHLVTLILSDVLGDPLDMIASGPTVHNTTNAQQAKEVLLALPDAESSVPHSVWNLLQTQIDMPADNVPWRSHVTNVVIGNIETAMNAAAQAAHRLGYEVEIAPIEAIQPTAEQAGQRFAAQIESDSGLAPRCIISGGEPVVHLVAAAQRGRGGRNQQLVLAALCELAERPESTLIRQFCLLSGGTDGEDGPTNAAGALVTESMIELAKSLDPRAYLLGNDAYAFFEKTDGLLITGPTHTNVCDLRVLLTRSTTP